VHFSGDALVVEDSGPGLSEEQRSRLGDRFYRPAGQSQVGSGLGISIVQRVAQLHGLAVRFDHRRDGPGLRVTVSRTQVEPPRGEQGDRGAGLAHGDRSVFDSGSARLDRAAG
jgi:two-component system sensor histidine kinase QseC